MKKCLAFILAVTISSPAWAQDPGRFDPAATRGAVAAVAAAAPGNPAPVTPTQRVITGTLIGGTTGVVTGWLLWNMFKDCGGADCAGRANAMVTMGVIGGGIGALIGARVGVGPSHPAAAPHGIPLGQHVA